MKKFIILTSIFAVLGVLLFVVSVKAQGSDPLALIWDWIGRLRERVTILEEEVANIELIPGPAGPQGPVGSPGPAGQQLHLYDANGQDLGILIESGQSPAIVRWHNVLVADLGLIATIEERGHPQNIAKVYGNVPIYFTQLNCTGNTFVGNPIDHYTVVKNTPLSKYFKFVGTVAPSTTIFPSWIGDSGNCQNSLMGLSSTFQVEEINLSFTEPLAWPLHIQ